jgi:tRNA-dihydrouridine synthase 3
MAAISPAVKVWYLLAHTFAHADESCLVGLANSFLQGSKEEYSLIRRHPSEKTFGIQVAGGKPQLLVPTAEILGKVCAGNLDFVDLNCGCPIDLVYKTGSGSARK